MMKELTANITIPGRVFVHCLMGVSRSATLVVAFLMIAEGLSLQEAVATVRPQRRLSQPRLPDAALQLCSLHMGLERGRGEGDGRLKHCKDTSTLCTHLMQFQEASSKSQSSRVSPSEMSDMVYHHQQFEM